MSRTIKSILLLIIIFISASGIPLYADTINWHFDFELSKPDILSKNESILIDSNVNIISPSQVDLELIVKTKEKNLKLNLNQTNPVSLTLYFKDEEIMTIQPENVIISVSDTQALVIQIKLPQDLLNIPNGDYELEARLNIENLEGENLSERVSISYQRDMNYIKPLESITRNETALTLYFPDNNANYLIPITRVIPYTKTPLRSTVDNLKFGPKESMGLLMGSPIPEIEGLSLNRRIANVYLPKDIGIYNDYSSTARLALDSFLYSLTAIQEVEGVQFYFDNKILTDGFHGRLVDKPLNRPKTAKYYTGYITDTDQCLLLPISTTDIVGSTPTVDILFDGLKYSSQLLPYNYYLQPTVPEDLILLDYSADGTNLKLYMNEAFITAYSDLPDYRKLMVDSIIYTFTSLDDISSVEFFVEGFTSTESQGIPLGQPISRPAYINPES